MDIDYWQKQTADTPLFPDMLWSRPENRLHAGKLLIVGGNAQGFAAAGEAFTHATRAGAGVVRMYLPDVLQKPLGKHFLAGEFGPSTPSGSFSRRALAEGLAMAHWADGVLLAGDLGRNSETAIFIEKFISKYTGPLVLTKDAADYCICTPGACINRPETAYVISLAQLQKLAIGSRFTTAFTYDMDLLRLVAALHEFSLLYPAAIVVRHHDTIFVAVQGQVSSTRLSGVRAAQPVWRVRTAAAAAVWWLQNPSKSYEALTISLVA